MATKFWDAAKSTRLSIVCTWVAIAGALAAGVVLPFLPVVSQDGPVRVDPAWIRLALTPIYLCLAAGLVALVLLLKLLYAIGRDQVFTLDNVRRLRLISYCGFAIAVVCLVAGLVIHALIAWTLVALVAAFLGLIMRVIKNVIDAARLLKEDADYTI